MCSHQPPCPTADSSDRDAAAVLSAHPEQGWSLLCNDTILFDDTGELLPDGRVVPPRRCHGRVAGSTVRESGWEARRTPAVPAAITQKATGRKKVRLSGMKWVSGPMTAGPASIPR